MHKFCSDSENFQETEKLQCIRTFVKTSKNPDAYACASLSAHYEDNVPFSIEFRVNVMRKMSPFCTVPSGDSFVLKSN